MRRSGPLRSTARAIKKGGLYSSTSTFAPLDGSRAQVFLYRRRGAPRCPATSLPSRPQSGDPGLLRTWSWKPRIRSSHLYRSAMRTNGFPAGARPGGIGRELRLVEWLRFKRASSWPAPTPGSCGGARKSSATASWPQRGGDAGSWRADPLISRRVADIRDRGCRHAVGRARPRSTLLVAGPLKPAHGHRLPSPSPVSKSSSMPLIHRRLAAAQLRHPRARLRRLSPLLDRGGRASLPVVDRYGPVTWSMPTLGMCASAAGRGRAWGAVPVRSIYWPTTRRRRASKARAQRGAGHGPARPGDRGHGRTCRSW